jgi:hypothetical protein
MTTATTRPASGVRPAYRTRDHIVTGTAVQLSNLKANHCAAGTLVSHSEPLPVTGGRFQVVFRLVEQLPARPVPQPAPVRSGGEDVAARRRRTSARRVVLITAGAVVTLAGLGYLIGRLVQVAAANLPLILGVLAVLGVVLVGLRRGGVCTGIHCPGCGHR